jgi:hypothetical protein
MGYPQKTRADVGAVDGIAVRFDDAAVQIEQAARSLLVFDAAVAGRAHSQFGAELRRGTEAVLADLSVWSRAAAEIGAGLRAGARRYRDADQSAADGIG